MRIERAKAILANVESRMEYWKEAMRHAKNADDRNMFYELYKVASNAARRIEERLEEI